MSGLLIVADGGRLTAAAGFLRGASGQAAGSTLPSLGDAAAEESMGRFASGVGAYHANLSRAAGDGAVLLERYRETFLRIDR
ncbi:MAG: hypothetical protein J2P58_04920 [Acidimicrobiaceae bacterium]|nr:hypothetical protein [Acidimicrobiaceae bacterium]